MRRYGILILASIFINACGQDRTIDDYYNQRSLQEANKYKKIAGTYTGLAYQKDSKKPLAEVMLTLISSTRVDTSGKTPVSVPVLLSEIKLRSPYFRNDLILNTEGGYYIEEEDLFQTYKQVNVGGTPGNPNPGQGAGPGASPSVQNYISLKGRIFSDSVIAELANNSLSETALKVDLKKSTTWPRLSAEDFAEDKFPGPKVGEVLEYNGESHFVSGEKRRASLKLSPASASNEELIAVLLSKERNIYGRLRLIESDVAVGFNNMRWNVVSRTLAGVAFFGPYEIRLECIADQFEQDYGWDCDYNSSGGGSLTHIIFERTEDEEGDNED